MTRTRVTVGVILLNARGEILTQERPLLGQVLEQLFGRSAHALTNFCANDGWSVALGEGDWT